MKSPIMLYLTFNHGKQNHLVKSNFISEIFRDTLLLPFKRRPKTAYTYLVLQTVYFIDQLILQPMYKILLLTNSVICIDKKVKGKNAALFRAG